MNTVWLLQQKRVRDDSVSNTQNSLHRGTEVYEYGPVRQWFNMTRSWGVRKGGKEVRWKTSWSPIVDGLGEGSEFYFVDTRES